MEGESERRRRKKKGRERRTRNTKIPFRSISRQVNRPSGLGHQDIDSRNRNRDDRHRFCYSDSHPRFTNTRRSRYRLHTLIPSLTAASWSPLPSSAKILEATVLMATTPSPSPREHPGSPILRRTRACDIQWSVRVSRANFQTSGALFLLCASAISL